MYRYKSLLLLAFPLFCIGNLVQAEVVPMSSPSTDTSAHPSPLPADYDLDALIREAETLDTTAAGQRDLPAGSRAEVMRLKTISDAICRSRPVVDDEIAKQKCQRLNDTLQSVQQKTNTSDSSATRE
ncbi:MAG: hypothetical protein IT290_12800 [Deltaproteobacteria bacterium]|nr:hypothetical protein [Deltaproteobacteria bacterium]